MHRSMIEGEKRSRWQLAVPPGWQLQVVLSELPLEEGLPLQGRLLLEGGLPLEGELPLAGGLSLEGGLPLEGELSLEGAVPLEDWVTHSCELEGQRQGQEEAKEGKTLRPSCAYLSL